MLLFLKINNAAAKGGLSRVNYLIVPGLDKGPGLRVRSVILRKCPYPGCCDLCESPASSPSSSVPRRQRGRMEVSSNNF
jgi:hypothetical protein